MQPGCVKGQALCGTVYGDLHLKDLLGSFPRVGYCKLVPDFHLVLHGLRCQNKQCNGLINQSTKMTDCIPVVIAASAFFFISEDNWEVAVRYFVTKTLGEKLIIFCSPHPYGMRISRSRPDTVDPIKSPEHKISNKEKSKYVLWLFYILFIYLLITHDKVRSSEVAVTSIILNYLKQF